MKKTTVFVADDHPIMLDGIVHIISGHNMEIVGTAHDGKEALEKLIKLKPSVAILDIVMPGLSGTEVAKALHEKKIATKIILLTGLPHESWLENAMSHGVSGYVLKENTFEELMSAISHVLKGNSYVSPLIGGKLLEKHGVPDDQGEARLLMETLTVMEKKVLLMVAESRTTRDISETLHVSEKTVQNHRANICKKFGITGTNALLHFAIQNKSHIQ